MSHYVHQPGKSDLEEFAKELKHGVTPDYAKLFDIAALGGDGSFLYPLHAAGKRIKVIGLVPPWSNSTGFWCHHGVKTAQDFMDVLDQVKAYPCVPLKAEIEYQDGAKQLVKAFNEVAFKEKEGQSILFDLKIKDGDQEETYELMGDGVIISSALGSTGLNRSALGNIIDLTNPGTVVTPFNINSPTGGFIPLTGRTSRVISENAEVEVTFKSQYRRHMRLLRDNQLPVIPEDGNSFQTVKITRDPSQTQDVLMAGDVKEIAQKARIPNVPFYF